MSAEEKIEKRLRQFTIEKLKVLNVLASHTTPMISSRDISLASGFENKELGGILSSLSRTKIGNEPIILSVVRSQDQGVIWKFNESALPKEETKEKTRQIMREAAPYFASL